MLDGSVTLVASEGIASYEQHHPELGTAALVNLRSQIVVVAVQVAIAGSALRRYSGRERDLPSERVLLQVVVISWAGPGRRGGAPRPIQPFRQSQTRQPDSEAN